MTISDTVEERILELQKAKRELAKAAIEGKAVGNLGLQEMLKLFRHGEFEPDMGPTEIQAAPPRLLPSHGERSSMNLESRSTASSTDTYGKRSENQNKNDEKGKRRVSAFERRW